MEKASRGRKPADPKEDVAASYNAFKEFHGKKYTGMRVGGGHTWYYDKGEWKETKVTPDEWQFTYDVMKKRKGHAPEGSGAPLGTEYHWYVMADQIVKKVNANEYTTSMKGLKYKLAHRRAGTERWSASERAQIRHLIKILEDHINVLQLRLRESEGAMEAQPQEREPGSLGPLPEAAGGRRAASGKSQSETT